MSRPKKEIIFWAFAALMAGLFYFRSDILTIYKAFPEITESAPRIISDIKKEILTGLDNPHGLAFYKGKLYVDEERKTAEQFIKMIDDKYIRSNGLKFWMKLAEKFDWIKSSE